jgi:hypothetical protein
MTETVAALPPWEREEFHYKEAPDFLKHQYNLSVGWLAVYRWIRKGLPKRDGSGKAKLAGHFVRGKLFIKRADLETFIKET